MNIYHNKTTYCFQELLLLIHNLYIHVHILNTESKTFMIFFGRNVKLLSDVYVWYGLLSLLIIDMHLYIQRTIKISNDVICHLEIAVLVIHFSKLIEIPYMQ